MFKHQIRFKTKTQAVLRTTSSALLGAACLLSGAGLAASHLLLNWFVPVAEARDKPLTSQHLEYTEWILPDVAPTPDENRYDPVKAELGKQLFFDPRLSGNGKMSCATCHNPAQGWSDGLPTGRGHEGKVLGRATPTIINVGFNTILMWDGRARDLEEQAMGPIENPDEMANSAKNLVKTLNGIPGYVTAFEKAYPQVGIKVGTIRRSIAMYQRRVVANRSPFDRWVKGDQAAMTEQQVRGFKVFIDPSKGNCALCHQPPNFTDNGFHNVGLASYGKKEPDLGRHLQKQFDLTKGAFKTPPLRNIVQTAPYFHDGSAATLRDVVDHYATGGVVKTDVSPNINRLNISVKDKEDLVEFLKALTSEIDRELVQVKLP